MCGRYTGIDESQLPRLNEISYGFRMYTTPEADEMCPGRMGCILTQHGDLISAKWGFQRGKGLVFNARIETLRVNYFFAPHLEFGRCVAPAMSYYEWNPDKVRFTITKHKQPLWLCALMRPAPDSLSGFEYTIVTQPADESVAFIHPRMPVVLDDDGAKLWLQDGDISSTHEEMIVRR